MRISDWSSDVCSSDLGGDAGRLADGTLDPAERAGLATGQLPLRAQRTGLRAFASSARPRSRRRTLMAGYNFLEGIRVLEVAQLGPSSLGGYLADMGAEVVKIEGHDGEPLRHSRSEEHTSELQSLMRISYAVFVLKKKKQT